jgi:hypothetical protein
MSDQSPPKLPDYHVTKELDALYVRALQGQVGQRVLRTFEAVFEREDHAAQPMVKPLSNVLLS